VGFQSSGRAADAGAELATSTNVPDSMDSEIETMVSRTW
jgi:hypothetical protein